MFIINLLNLTQQAKLSQYISISVQVKQELISIRKQLNQRTQRYSSSIKHESRIYLQIVQLLFSAKSFHNPLKSLTRMISLWNLYMDLWMMSLFILLFSWSVHTETVCVLWNHNPEVSWFSKQPQITPNRKSCYELLLVIITIIQITCHKQQKWWLIILSHFKYQTYHHQPNPISTKGKLPMSFSFHISSPSKKKHILFVLVLFIWLSLSLNSFNSAFNTPPIKELIDTHWYEITFIILNLIELMFLRSHSPSCYIWMITVWVCHKPSLSIWHWW